MFQLKKSPQTMSLCGHVTVKDVTLYVTLYNVTQSMTSHQVIIHYQRHKPEFCDTSEITIGDNVILPKKQNQLI